MAVFNPQVPGTQDPNYLGYSRPTEAPSADLSTGMALKSIGEGVAGVIGIADDYMKNTAKLEARQAADAAIDIRSTILKTQTPDAGVIPAPVQTPAGAAVGKPVQLVQQSLMDANASADMPDGVEEGLSRIRSLDAAKDGGKINDTYYTGNLYSEAKRLRAKYPGYREYIDQEISHVTGINPAKEYIGNLMQDINAQRTAGQKTSDKILGELLSLNKEGVGGAPDAIDHFRRTNDIPRAIKWMNEAKATDYTVKGLEAGLALDKNTEEQTRRRMESAFSLKAEGHVNNIWSAASMNAGVQTPQEIADSVTKAGIGGAPLSGADQQAKALNITAQRNSAEVQLRKMGEQLIEIKRSDGSVIKTSYAAALGPEKFNAIISEKLKRFDVVRDSITNDKTGTATFAATVNQRVKADYENGIITDPANEQLNAIEYLNRTAGPNWQNLVTKKALTADVDSIVSGLLVNKTNTAAAGPRPGKPAPSFKQDVSEAKDGRNTVDGSPVNPNTKYFDRLVDNISLLTVPTLDPKELAGQKNIADYFFHPRNRNALSNFSLDVYDSNGNKIPGRESIFRTLTVPEISGKIKKLSENDPQLMINYRNWVEYEWGQKIFAPHLNQMKDFLTEGANASKVFTDSRGVNVAFSDKDNQIYIIDNKGQPINRNIGKTTVEQNYFDLMSRNVRTLNEGLRNLSTMHKELGGDTTKYLLDTMTHAGIDISTNKLGKAIVNSTEEAGRRIEENLKKSGLKIKPSGSEETPTRTSTGANN